MIFLYDKNNDLTMFAKFQKKDLANLCLAKGKQFFNIEISKEKNKTNIRKVVINFEGDVKLWFQQLERYEYSLRAISKNSTSIKFPTQISRIETSSDGTPKLFTIQPSVIDKIINKF
jgi:hypothetical protein